MPLQVPKLKLPKAAPPEPVPVPVPEPKKLIDDLESQRHARRLETLRDNFRTAMAGIDRAKTANDDVYRKRLEMMGPLNLKPATFAGTKGQRFIKLVNIKKP